MKDTKWEREREISVLYIKWNYYTRLQWEKCQWHYRHISVSALLLLPLPLPLLCFGYALDCVCVCVVYVQNCICVTFLASHRSASHRQKINVKCYRMHNWYVESSAILYIMYAINKSHVFSIQQYFHNMQCNSSISSSTSTNNIGNRRHGRNTLRNYSTRTDNRNARDWNISLFKQE